jgi:hypothetical protein
MLSLSLPRRRIAWLGKELRQHVVGRFNRDGVALAVVSW